jgi:hypothetical protein
MGISIDDVVELQSSQVLLGTHIAITMSRPSHDLPTTFPSLKDISKGQPVRALSRAGWCGLECLGTVRDSAEPPPRPSQ